MTLAVGARFTPETFGTDAEATAVAAALREERARIGRELHDGVIQTLYALGLGLEAAIQVMETDAPLARARLIRSRDAINNAIEEVRAYVVGLRVEDDPVPPLARRFAAVAGELALDLAVAVSPRVEGALTPTEAQQLYLIGREALTNVAKHAHARHVHLGLVHAGPRGGWVFTVRDDGVGLGARPSSATSFGLRTMRERARLLGAELTLASHPRRGTEVRVVRSATTADR